MRKQLLVLAGLIAATGITWAAAPPDGPKPDGPGRERGKARLKAALGLTDAQLADLKKLRTEQAKKKIRLGADMKVAQLELHELLLAPTVDEKAVRAKAKQVADLQAAGANDRVEAMLALRKVVNAEQAEKLMRLHHAGKGRGEPRRMHHMQGPGGGPQGPRGPRGPNRRGPRMGDAETDEDAEIEEGSNL